MNIVDSNALIPDHSVIEHVIATHPFSSNLRFRIRKVTVKSHKGVDSSGPRIKFDHDTHEAILYMAPATVEKSNYEYILYHEFGHLADQLSTEFGYSNQARFSLSDIEQINLMEIWNLYIDARLHHHNLFQWDPEEKPLYSLMNGKLQKLPCTIQGKLVKHINFLKSRGIIGAEQIVRKIWENPNEFMSYQDMISIVTTSNG